MKIAAAIVAFALEALLPQASSAFPAKVFTGCADVALVLAIDASGSISPQDFSVQQHGYVQAFRHPAVQRALRAAGVVDVAVVMWGDTEMMPQILSWQRLETPADAEMLAARIDRIPRIATGNTGIGRGLWAALDLLDAHGACALRQIINVSGDGYESMSPRPRLHVSLHAARARAGAMGVTVNALAIETEVADLGQWYAERVIVGPGAFVMRVQGFDTFAMAIAEKLEREIGPPELAALGAEAGP